MIALGIGYSSGCTGAELVTLIRQVCETHGVALQKVRVAATIPDRAMGPALIEAALNLGLAIVVPPEQALRLAAEHCLTRSERSLNRFSLPSVSEACALAAAGQGEPKDARLIAPRMQSARATCAIALSGDDDREREP